MEHNKELNFSENDTSGSVPEEKNMTKEPKKKSINLLKGSKHDLLRLLSILEGELEARDIFISTLQAQLNNQKNARKQYYVHRLTDPFLSLHRDDYVVGNGANGDNNQTNPNELVHIEPLPLLEKVVYQFKSQQQKMHQQMALASKIHRKMAHELAEEKRKHAVDTKTGDDITMALEKERERLKASVMCGRERTKRIETEYKKLLVLCKEEGRKHKMIVMALLAEQERLLQQLKESRELKIDIDSTETELQAKLHEALKQKQELAMRLKEEQVKCSGLQTRMINLERQISQLNNKKPLPHTHQSKSALEQATALFTFADTKEETEEDEPVMPELPAKMSRVSSSSSEDSPRPSSEQTSFFTKHHPMSVAQSTRDVTLVPTSSHPPILLADGVGVTTSGYYSVKPGYSIAGLDAMKSSATSKEMLSLELAKDDVFEAPVNEARIGDKNTEVPSPPNMGPKPPSATGPPKPNRFIPGSTHYTPFRSSHTLFNERTNFAVTSSPTSGAANFAMNSPNSPVPPANSPFSLTRSSSIKASPRFPVTKIEAPTKLSAFATKNSPGRTPVKPGHNSKFQSTRMKFQSSPQNSAVSNENEATASKENITTEKKFQGKKFTSVTYKSHITQKVTSSPTTLPNVTKSTSTPKQDPVPLSDIDKIKQPLPPKTRPSTAPSTASQVRPPPLPPKKPSLSSDKPAKRTATPDGSKNQESPLQRKSGSVKRAGPSTASFKANNGNENSSKNGIHSMTRDVKGPTPPSLPAKMSSQQPAPTAGPRQPLSTQQRTKSSTDSDSVR